MLIVKQNIEKNNISEEASDCSIAAFKVSKRNDNATADYEKILWNDPKTDTFYMSESIYSEKH